MAADAGRPGPKGCRGKRGRKRDWDVLFRILSVATLRTPLRTINRWEHEAVLEEHQARMERDGKAMMRRRSAFAEHPFGTMKRWLGWDHFLLRGFDKVRGEMALYVFGYNFRRVLTILGIEEARDYFASRRLRPVGEGAEMTPA